jgi:hypothetical protein
MFLMDVRDGRFPEGMLRHLLYRHAETCDCDCAACVELQQRHQLLEQDALH